MYGHKGGLFKRFLYQVGQILNFTCEYSVISNDIKFHQFTIFHNRTVLIKAYKSF